jgi:hypothetical protein
MKIQHPFNFSIIPDNRLDLEGKTDSGTQNKFHVLQNAGAKELMRLNDIAKKHPFGAWYKHKNHFLL